MVTLIDREFTVFNVTDLRARHCGNPIYKFVHG
jgi:hypothetical protein